ncbi:DNA-processing protein DprA [Patescibacteria group bacterium]
MTYKIEKIEPEYPFLLREIYKPPDPIYFRGKKEYLKKTCISIVGTRKNTEYGKSLCWKIVEDLTALDVVIVSGLAYGIDTIAHQAALKMKLPTIAVLGSGIERIYPEANRDLAEEIAEYGLIISEYPGKEAPKAYNFVARNRIISGLSIATIIVEAPEKSGALITAKYALDQGREIFAVPGDVSERNNLGTLGLLQYSAAYPIKDGKDVIDVLKRQPFLFSEPENNSQKSKKKDDNFITTLSMDNDEKDVFFSISKKRSINVDKIIKKLQLPTHQVLSILSILEIKGLILCKNGKYLRKY